MNRVIKILPVIHHIAEQAKLEDYKEIIIGSFIRNPDAKNACSGHCAGTCIDINHTSNNFESHAPVEMVTRIFKYLLKLPTHLRKSIGFGLPQRGNSSDTKILFLLKVTDGHC